ncbi:hypothetical protein PVAP13_9KG170300 [Panicum virgatum]|uniref:Uncharacterized protein n=1 Tax=Panicum virgatum TaxID=38727 RepID=A0A8T0NJQ4_PANVG|nr:hypothetical protein PVAP13_9KG170300 [Panicum virgatum]
MKSPLASTPPSPSQARRSPLSRRRRKIHASTPVTPAAPHLTEFSAEAQAPRGDPRENTTCINRIADL